MFRSAALLAILLVFAAPGARAELYCVATSAQLRSALTDAASSSTASEIRVRKGFYSVPAVDEQSVSLQYTASSNLTMSGGWDGANNSCTVQYWTPDTTVLSASGVGRLFNIYLFTGSATQVILSNLSFWDGENASGANAAGCLTIETDGSSNAVVRLDRNAFRICRRTSGSGAALQITARSATISVRGNLFADNGSTSGAILLKGLGASTFYTNNNTVANNPQFGAGGGPGGMQITGLDTDFHWISNNVLWNNGTGPGYDLLLSAPIAVLNSNLIGTRAALPAGVVDSNNISVDPRFVSSVDFRPRANSPLRDSGAASPSGGAPATDFDAQERIAGERLDRGAYEFGEILIDSFE